MLPAAVLLSGWAVRCCMVHVGRRCGLRGAGGGGAPTAASRPPRPVPPPPPAGAPAAHLPPLLRADGAAAAEAVDPGHQRAGQAAQGGQGAGHQALPSRCARAGGWKHAVALREATGWRALGRWARGAARPARRHGPPSRPVLLRPSPSRAPGDHPPQTGGAWGSATRPRAWWPCTTGCAAPTWPASRSSLWWAPLRTARCGERGAGRQAAGQWMECRAGWVQRDERRGCPAGRPAGHCACCSPPLTGLHPLHLLTNHHPSSRRLARRRGRAHPPPCAPASCQPALSPIPPPCTADRRLLRGRAHLTLGLIHPVLHPPSALHPLPGNHRADRRLVRGRIHLGLPVPSVRRLRPGPHHERAGAAVGHRVAAPRRGCAWPAGSHASACSLAALHCTRLLV